MYLDYPWTYSQDRDEWGQLEPFNRDLWVFWSGSEEWEKLNETTDYTLYPLETRFPLDESLTENLESVGTLKSGEGILYNGIEVLFFIREFDEGEIREDFLLFVENKDYKKLALYKSTNLDADFAIRQKEPGVFSLEANFIEVDQLVRKEVLSINLDFLTEESDLFQPLVRDSGVER